MLSNMCLTVVFKKLTTSFYLFQNCFNFFVSNSVQIWTYCKDYVSNVNLNKPYKIKK